VTIDLALGGAQNTRGAGTDTLTSIEDLSGSRFGDTLLGNAVANAITGDAGNDVIRSADEKDILDGEAGNDILEGGNGNDAVNGGSGIDRASYTSAVAGVTVNLARTGPQNTVGAGTDTLTSIENLFGSALNDALRGSAEANQLMGAGGDDILQGRGEADTLTGGGGADVFKFAALADSARDRLDRITDLTSADKLDVASIDANGAGVGNGMFVRLPDDGAFTAAGQLRLLLDGRTTRLELNTDADAAAESVILLVGNHTAATAEDAWLL
jgi:Ca2+-binding RTX toxin-like protein